jgi:hypothetical protein
VKRQGILAHKRTRRYVNERIGEKPNKTVFFSCSTGGMSMLWTYRVFHDRDGYCIRIVYYERDKTLIGVKKQRSIK